MNKIYRTVYNETTNTWVAVEETAKSHRKSSGGVVDSTPTSACERVSGSLKLRGLTAAVAIALFSPLAVSPAFAADWNGGGDNDVIGAYSNASGQNNTVSGTDSFAAGKKNIVSGDYSMAVGDENKVSGTNSVSLGGRLNQSTSSGSATLGGEENTASALYSATVGGHYNQAASESAVAWGNTAFAGSMTANAAQLEQKYNPDGTLSLEQTAYNACKDLGGTNKGCRALTSLEEVITYYDDQIYDPESDKPEERLTFNQRFAKGVSGKGENATAWGLNTLAGNNQATAFGSGSIANGENSTAFGQNSYAYADNSLAALGGQVGLDSQGANNTAHSDTGLNSVAIGDGAWVQSDNSVAMGQNSVVGKDADKSLAMIGGQVSKNATGAIAVGNNAQAQSPHSVSIGTNAVTMNRTGTIAIGAGNPNLAGNGHNTSGALAGNVGAIAIGRKAEAVNATLNVQYDADGYAYVPETIGTETLTNNVGESFNRDYSYSRTIAPDNSNVMQMVAIGEDVAAYADQSIAIGSNTIAAGNASIAIGGDDVGRDGRPAKAHFQDVQDKLKDLQKELTNNGYDVPVTLKNATSSADAFKDRTLSVGDVSMALGVKAVSQGDLSNAIGMGARTIGANSNAIGTVAFAGAENSVALGSVAMADEQAEKSVAVGYMAQTGGKVNVAEVDSVQGMTYSINGEDPLNVTALGSQSGKGENSVAVGEHNKVLGNNSTAVGQGNIVLGNNSIAIGDPNVIIGDDSAAQGNNNIVAANNAHVFGNRVTKTADNSVFLGADTAYVKDGTTKGSSEYTDNYTIGTAEYENDFKATTPVGVVSVGDTDKERRIQNVAAGWVDKNSTDAINGSQLNAAYEDLQWSASVSANGGTVNTAVDQQVIGDYQDTKNKGIVNFKAGDGITIDTTNSGSLDMTFKVSKANGPTINDNGEVNKLTSTDNDADNGDKNFWTANQVADAINDSGWRIIGTDNDDTGTGGFSDTKVTPGDQITLVGGKNVDLKQEGNKFTFSVDIPKAAQQPVVYTDENGNKVVKNDAGDWVKADSDGNPTDETVTGNIIASMNDGSNSTISPMTLTNVASHLPETNNTTTNVATTDVPTSDYVNQHKNDAATLGDVLNAGWNLQGNGDAVDFVKPYDTVNFVNGQGTTAVVTSDGLVSNVTYNVGVDNKTTQINYVDNTGKPVTQNADGSFSDATGNPVDAENVSSQVVAKTTPLTMEKDGDKTTGKVNKPADDVKDSLVTAGDVANAINNAHWNVQAAADGGTVSGEELQPIKAGDTVDLIAGENVTIKQEQGKFTFSVDIPDASTSPITADKGKAKLGDVTTYTDADGNPLTQNSDGSYSNADGSPYTGDVTEAKSPADGNKLVTAGDVVNTVNNTGWNVGVGASPNSEKDALITPAGTNRVGFVEGNGVKITQDGANFTFAVNKAGAPNVPTTGDNAGKVDKPTTADQYWDAQQVSDAINNSGFVVNSGKTGSGTNSGNKAQLVKTGEEVKFIAGDGVDIAQNNAQFTIKNTWTVKQNADGSTTINDGSKDYVIGKDTDTNTITTLTANNGEKPNETKGNITLTKDGDNYDVSLNKDVTLGGAGDNNSGSLNVAGDTGNTEIKPNEINFTDAGDNNTGKITGLGSHLADAGDATEMPADSAPDKWTENKNDAATLGDVLNAGWNLQGNGNAVDFVTHGDTVNFVDGKLTKVSVENKDGVNNVKVDVNLKGGKDIEITDDGVINYTGADNNTVTSVTNTDGNLVVTPDLSDPTKPNYNIGLNNKITVGDDAPITIDGTTGDITLGGDNGGNINNVANHINPDGSMIDPAAPTNQAATVQDVLNSGWNVKVGDADPEYIKHGEQVAFIDGKGTKVSGSKDGIAYDINVDQNSPLSINNDGALTVDVGGFDNTTDGSVKANNPNGLATAGDVANAVNNSGWNVTTSASTGEVSGTSKELIKPTNTVTFDAGDNIRIVQSGNQISVGTTRNINVAGNLNVAGDTTVGNLAVNPGSNVDMGGNQIHNVAPGTADTDAVNVSQLKQAVGGDLTNVHNRIDGAYDHANASAASAIAVASMPQAYLPGKSLIAIGGGSYRGQTGYAIGISSISDGGNWIIKGTATGNSKGNYGVGLGAGYQW